MNEPLLEQLLNEPESNALDFKRDQYPFNGATDEQKSELLKDILAFTNAWRRSDAFILIGVEENRGGRSKVVGVQSHLQDHTLQQFVNSKTYRPLIFSYEVFPFENNLIGIIHIPIQERPLYLRKQYGGVKEQAVYVRRGSATEIAAPDEIARMGLARQDEVNLQIELQFLAEELARFANLSLDNFYKSSIAFSYEQYQRLFDKGIISRLDSTIRALLTETFSELKLIDHLCKSGWGAKMRLSFPPSQGDRRLSRRRPTNVPGYAHGHRRQVCDQSIG
jgi:schlafen family protein